MALGRPAASGGVPDAITGTPSLGRPRPVPAAVSTEEGGAHPMDTLEAIRARRSAGSLAEPAPSHSELRAMLGAAVAAPDHGLCRPWRFVVLEGGVKDAFGLVLDDAYRKRCARAGTSPDAAKARKERTKLERAPVVVVTGAVPQPSAAAPPHEQYAAVAAATQNLLLAATELGYGSMWRTGEAARDAMVKAELGFGSDDSIVGFVYLGTVPSGRSAPPAREPDSGELEDKVEFRCAPPPEA